MLIFNLNFGWLQPNARYLPHHTLTVVRLLRQWVGMERNLNQKSAETRIPGFASKQRSKVEQGSVLLDDCTGAYGDSALADVWAWGDGSFFLS